MKSALHARAGPCRGCENGYIRRNLWFSYDRVLRVGPSGPALFYYLNDPASERRSGLRSGSTAGPTSVQEPVTQTHASRPILDPGYDRSTLPKSLDHRAARRAASGGRAGRGRARVARSPARCCRAWATGWSGSGFPARPAAPSRSWPSGRTDRCRSRIARRFRGRCRRCSMSPTRSTAPIGWKFPRRASTGRWCAAPISNAMPATS